MSNEKQPQDFTKEDDLYSFFDNFIKKGVVIKEKEIVPGFNIKIKVLDTGELLSAESVLSVTNPNIPYDIIQKVRAASVLSQAIISINGINVEQPDAPTDVNYQRRSGLYSKLLKMPALVIQQSYELYIEAVREQNSLYNNQVDMSDKVENF